MSLLTLRSDVFVIGYLLGARPLAYYNTAVVLGEAMVRISGYAGMVLFPLVAGSQERTAAEFTLRIAQRSILVFAIVAVGIAAFGKIVLIMLFGQEFKVAYPALLLLLPGHVALSLNQVLCNHLAGQGYPAVTFRAPTCALMLNLGLNLWLIPRWGITAAAFSTTLAYIIWTVLIVRHFCSSARLRYTQLLSVPW